MSKNTLKKIYKKCKKKFSRYINGTKGVISLFLAILMVPFLTIAGCLINAARVNSAIAVFDEALCNASNSTLGTYDEFLRERFGLLAMSQDTASKGAGYTAQDLISDTFKFYMEESLGALSNTYTSHEISATGVLPLADTDVLLSQVFEYSKYTVPTKLVINGLSIDSILSTLTESLSFGTQILDTFSAGSGLVSSISECDDKLNTLKEKITAAQTAKTEYDTAYNAFVGAVNAYNDLVDEYKPKYEEKKQAIDDASGEVNSCIQRVAEAETAVSPVLQQIEAIRNSQLMVENPMEAEAQIHDIELANASLIQAYSDANSALSTANGKLATANNNMTSLNNSYADKFNDKRTSVTTTKSTYATEIDQMSVAIKETWDAVTAAQSSISSVLSSSQSLASNITQTVYVGQQKASEKKIEDMKESKKAAADREDHVAEYLWQDEIDAAKQEQLIISNVNTLQKAQDNADKKTASTLEEFVNQAYFLEYKDVYERLRALLTTVNAYTVSTSNLTKCADATSLYETISTSLTVEIVQKLQDNFASNVVESGFFAALKAMIEFAKAILSISMWFDPELCSNVDPAKYSAIGGLPSKKVRTDYPLTSGFEEVDQKKSDYYKSLLGEYLNNPIVTGSVTTGADVMTALQEGMNTLTDVVNNWGSNNIFTNIGKIGSAVLKILDCVQAFLKDAVTMITNMVYEKLLLAGYVAYNIPNRTTYTDSGLTGKGYSLPSYTSLSEHQGYTFYGAETEYIIHGSYSEISNQSSIFNSIYLIRLVFNLPGIFLNTEITGLAGEAGAATLGIGTFVVYGLYILLEPFVDTMILVNGGSIPVVKMKIYLTPSGMPDLISEFCNLKLSDAQKEAVSRKTVQVASLGKASDDTVEDYVDAIKNPDPNAPEPNKLVGALEYDYTKKLILILILFTPSDKIVNRLADVVQMESTYNAINRIDSYTFDLDKSYTYIRSEGKFETNEFIKISGSNAFNSNERVIYRGY